MIVDYFTGRTPLRMKKQMEEELDRIARERERQMRELLGEGRPAGGGESPPSARSRE